MKLSAKKVVGIDLPRFKGGITPAHDVAPPRCAIAPEEYDFSGVPNNELEVCLHYEYMRESEAIIREAREVRAQMVQEAKRQKARVGVPITMRITTTKVTHTDGILEPAMISMLAAASGFPDVPWQKLSQESKQVLGDFPNRAAVAHNKHLTKNHPMLMLDTVLKDSALGDCTLNTWKSKRTPPQYGKVPAPIREKFLVSGFIQINMGYKQEVLIDAFRDWLKANHPRGTEQPQERRGRDTPRDPLNALGALRLRFHCRTLEEAQKLIAPLASKAKGMGYSDRTAWNRACDRAVGHFHSILNLPEKQLPRHHTNGWKKSSVS